MSEIIQSTVSVRGKSYVVREMDGKTMIAFRKLLDSDEKATADNFIAFKCTIDPKFPTQDDVAKLPQVVTSKIVAEVMKLTAQDSGEAKND